MAALIIRDSVLHWHLLKHLVNIIDVTTLTICRVQIKLKIVSATFVLFLAFEACNFLISVLTQKHGLGF